METLKECYSLQPLDEQTKAILEEQNKLPDALKSIKNIPLAELRKLSMRVRVKDTPYIPHKIPGIASIENLTIQGSHGPIPLRLYTPDTHSSLLPVLLFFHGGGWALGSLDDYDSLCQQLAVKAEYLVVSVDYHLAPEHPFPTPLEDCYESVKWTAKNIAKYKGDPEKLSISGDSAGGNLASAAALMARDLKEVKLKNQVLIYPVMSYQFNTLSYECFKEGYFLTREDMQRFWDYYAIGKNKTDPYLSPLAAKNLKDLPSSLLIVADYDVLRDDAVAYGWRLQESGVPVTLKKYGSIHGFMMFDALDIGKEAINEMADWMKNNPRNGTSR